MDTPELGIVIPALDEAEALPDLLRDLAQLDLRHEVLVVDGGSRDETVQAARRAGARVMRSRTGRARQMNAGARLLRTPWLLIVHADSRLDSDALRAVESHVRAARSDAACLRLAIAHRHLFYRFIEAAQRIRARAAGLVYGDQGLLIRRDLFFGLGPYPDVPIMEDVILNRRLVVAGRLRTLPATITTSPRRYEEEGRLRAWVRNLTLITRFLLDASPAELAHRYPPRRPRPAASPSRRGIVEEEKRATLLVFAKAPRPGKVKTRLARSIGEVAAAEVYRRMGRFVVDRLAAVQATVTVCYDPPGAGDEVRAWLGDTPARYMAQPPGDLGQRMARMFERAFEAADRVIVIGTDAPAVDGETVNRALDALDSADVVLGPATDGGYYLMGLRAPCPALFEGIAWSTDTVLRDTAARAREAGLRLTWLELESDIDTADDLTPEVLERLGLDPAPGGGRGV
ncbi:MAG: DUF2064 domain-containing protein [Gemmatimonadetes bacterium]|nr:DUF2064 domain-containing protein [Gemmatimonadota bacterium]MYG20859.1 DUF2064 domain-containing protein [Gemmatimonadota bacterium]MYJ39988.1 DUF2064 domain-containing protein [Gemmatimonadota bacterium]